MTSIAIVAAYLVYAAFIIRILLHVRVWWRAPRQPALYGAPVPQPAGRLFASAAGDIFFFRRLFRVNSVLWFGGWLFHLFFFLTVIRHLRYFLDPVPGWIGRLQPLGLCAGYLLPLALLYIFVIRLLTEREKYFSVPNFLIMALLFLISITGVLMHGIFRPDVVGMKEFIMGLVTFKPVLMPKSFLFIVHFFLVLLLMPFLPSHVFTAPLVMMEARKRDEGLSKVMHD